MSVYRLEGLSGRMGNRLLQHIDAFSFAEREGINIKSNDAISSNFVREHRRGYPLRRIGRSWRISESLINRGVRINLQDYFWTAGEIFSKPSAIGVIHFRGTDFASWKSHSIIDSNFFLEAVRSYIDVVTTWVVVTDDPSHLVVKDLSQSLLSECTYLGAVSTGRYADYCRLMNAPLIIASPSTFALSAAVLGRGAIVFPKSYAAIEAEKGSEFWAACVNGEFINYVDVRLA